MTDTDRMPKASREFQIFAKPAGSLCNLACRYCYYLDKADLFPQGDPFRMPDDLLEAYILQHIEACPGTVISFSWHGGEPTLLGLDYFRRIVALQKKHCPSGRRVVNGIQTNGTLIDDDWGRFLAAERFGVGLSLDGPAELHDAFRLNKGGQPTHALAMRGYDILRRRGVAVDVLCVVHAENVRRPLDVYRFFKEIGAAYIGFLPLVEPGSDRSVPPEAWGDFLIAVFDEWVDRDIGRVKVQIFEEAASTALGREHALCIFRQTCGEALVIEHNGDVYACDHFVDPDHRLGNIRETPLADMIGSNIQRDFGRAKWNTLPQSCRTCNVLTLCHGGCPKDRIIDTPDGEPGLNCLCAGYKRFFNHCGPFLNQLAALSRQQSQSRPLPAATDAPKTGRNDPCPCGSGKKYKKCCMGK